MRIININLAVNEKCVIINQEDGPLPATSHNNKVESMYNIILDHVYTPPSIKFAQYWKKKGI